KTKRESRRWKFDGGEIYQVFLSPDESLLAVSTRNALAESFATELFKLATGEKVSEHPGFMFRDPFSDGGKLLLTQDGKTAFVWDTQSHAKVFSQAAKDPALIDSVLIDRG